MANLTVWKFSTVDGAEQALVKLQGWLILGFEDILPVAIESLTGLPTRPERGV